MNKRGFTLIELLAVIAILGMLIAIISPVVTKLLNESKNEMSSQQRSILVEAAKEYMIENPQYLPELNDSYNVTVSALINGGIIENDKVVDPKTKKTLNGCIVVTYSSSYNQYEYNYVDNC